MLDVRTSYLRWTQEQLAYCENVGAWLIEGLEAGHIQDMHAANKQKIARAVEIVYQGPGRVQS